MELSSGHQRNTVICLELKNFTGIIAVFSVNQLIRNALSTPNRVHIHIITFKVFMMALLILHFHEWNYTKED